MSLLVDLLQQTPPPMLDAVDLSPIRLDNYYQHTELKGRIAEQFVKEWLGRYRFVFADSLAANMYSAKNAVRGLTVKDAADNQVHEFDIAGMHDALSYFIEVKAVHLEGTDKKTRFEDKIDRAFAIAMNFSERPQVLVFVPFKYNKRKVMAGMEERFPDLTFIDTGYTLKQLQRTVDRFYDEGR